jgi:MFS family permease
VVFAVASACAGLAPTFWLLVIFRALQGAGGALMLPTTVAIVSATLRSGLNVTGPAWNGEPETNGWAMRFHG